MFKSHTSVGVRATGSTGARASKFAMVAPLQTLYREEGWRMVIECWVATHVGLYHQKTGTKGDMSEFV